MYCDATTCHLPFRRTQVSVKRYLPLKAEAKRKSERFVSRRLSYLEDRNAILGTHIEMQKFNESMWISSPFFFTSPLVRSMTKGAKLCKSLGCRACCRHRRRLKLANPCQLMDYLDRSKPLRPRGPSRAPLCPTSCAACDLLDQIVTILTNL